MDKFKRKYLIGLILILGVILRFGWFGVSPPSLNWDEASLGYNAFSILKTGRDEWGKFLPFTFEAFGDFKLPGYIYSTVPFIGILGLNEFSVRLPSFIAGVFSILFLYLIIKKLTENETWALMSAFLLSISPWHIFLSRIALEANLAFCFFLIGFYFFIDGLKKGKSLVLSALFFGLTLFTYNSARVFVPLFLIALVLIYKRQLLALKEKLIIPVLIITIFISFAGFLAVFEDSASRYFWVNILDTGAINYINESRGNSNLDPTLTKLIYNRPLFFGVSVVKNYLSHFTVGFLFTRGGSNYQFSVPDTGLIYWIEFPFLLTGIWKLIRGKKNKEILIWLFLAPIPAAITRESPHVLRSIFMLGALQVIVAFGITSVLGLMPKKAVSLKRISYISILTICLLSLAGYLYRYFVIYPKVYSESWQYGIKQALEYVNTKANLGERPLFITKKYGEAHIFWLFYNQYDPAKYQSNLTLVRYHRSNWTWVDKLDNVYFINDWEMKDKLKDLHGYVITTPGNYVGTPNIQKSIKFLDGKVAFEVVEI